MIKKERMDGKEEEEGKEWKRRMKEAGGNEARERRQEDRMKK